jgi:papain like cysteine protease AvrRpt2
LASVLERTRVPLSVEAREREAVVPSDAGGRPIPSGPPPSWVRLNFEMQHQEHDQWCWAAVSTSVALYFDPGADWKQCKVVSAELWFGFHDCCADGASDACNRWWYLDRALRRTDTFERVQDGAPAELTGVYGELDAGRPVGVRIGWRGGGGHFIAIEGYRGDGNFLALEDPWYGTSDVAVATLRDAYHGTGTWTHVYYTRAPR